MPFSSMSRRALLGAAIASLAAAGPATAQSDELAGIPNVERLTQEQQATYRRRLRDATGDQERARIREEARLQARERELQGQGSGSQGSGGGRGSGGQGGGNPQGSGGQGGGNPQSSGGQGGGNPQGSGGQGGGKAMRRIPGAGGGRGN